MVGMKKIVSLCVILVAGVTFQRCINHGSSDTSNQSTDTILVYSSQTITEAASNDGTFDAIINVTLRGTEFASALTEGVDFKTSDLPDGLTVDVTRVSSTTATIHFSGQATSHSFCENGKMNFFFTNDAFADARLPISYVLPITIVYFSPTLTYSADTVNEDSVNNDGSFPTTFTITASNGGQFMHSGSAATANAFLTQGVDFEWAVPAGLTPVIQADALSPTTQVNVSFVNSASSSSPTSDITATLKFLSGGVSTNFCTATKKKDIDFVFVKDIVMYSASTTNGNLAGRVNADLRCYIGRPLLPAEYTNFRAFISVSGSDEIRDMPANYAVPTAQNIESPTGKLLDPDWASLLSGTILQSLSAASVGAALYYWTGSDTDGSVVANTCTAWTNAISGTGGVGTNAGVNGTWLNDTSSGAVTASACTSAGNSLLCLAYTN
jgi:hypothetical protein